MQLKEGSELQNGKYRIIRVLGQGGFGITYLAENTMLDKEVAIKEFFPKDFCGRDNTSHLTLGTQNNAETVEKLKARFLKEATNIAKLDHPGIIKIHDIFEENNTAYYVMDYIDGENLNEMVKRNGALSERKATGYITKVGKALEYIHSRQMTHFDVKPANIMVRKSDNMPILIDFGLSKQYDAQGDATSTLMQGVSHGYSPIELYNAGSITSFSPQTDVYSLAATLLYLLTGTTPHAASQLIEEGLDLPAGISPSIATAIEEGMAFSRTKRLPSISAFLKLLKSKTNTSTYKAPESQAQTPSEETCIINNPQNKPKIVNGYEAVDLGLSVLWATKDIGATDPFKRGDSFLWGDPNGSKTRKISNSILSKWFYNGPRINIIAGNILYDTATNLWGSRWRMPTIAEVKELFNNCDCIATNGNYIELLGPSGNSISIDSRWHWTGESPHGLMQPFCLVVDYQDCYFNFPIMNGKHWADCYFPIRPVSDK